MEFCEISCGSDSWRQLNFEISKINSQEKLVQKIHSIDTLH